MAPIENRERRFNHTVAGLILPFTGNPDLRLSGGEFSLYRIIKSQTVGRSSTSDKTPLFTALVDSLPQTKRVLIVEPVALLVGDSQRAMAAVDIDELTYLEWTNAVEGLTGYPSWYVPLMRELRLDIDANARYILDYAAETEIEIRKKFVSKTRRDALLKGIPIGISKDEWEAIIKRIRALELFRKQLFEFEEEQSS